MAVSTCGGVSSGWVGSIGASLIHVTLIALVATGCSDPRPVVEGSLAFVGVDVLPMTGAGPPALLENQTVVVTGRRIASIDPSDEVQVGANVMVVEAEGQYLMPGLAEMHGHLPASRLMPVDAKNLLFLYVANGVTTVRSMQGDPSHFRVRDQIARGETLGPRLFLASSPMTGSRVETPEHGEQLIREYHQAGYDLAKVHEGLTREVFDAVVAAANEVGLPFGGHVPDDVGLIPALAAGQTSIEHLDNYVEAVIPEGGLVVSSDLVSSGDTPEMVLERRLPVLVEATREAGTWVVPTMALWETVLLGDQPAAELRLLRPELRYMPPEITEQWVGVVDARLAESDSVTNRRVRQLRRTIMQALHEGGARMLLGSESFRVFSVPGFSIHHEMALWVELGMTPYEVLTAGTRRVAEYFDGVDDFGSVVVGHRADLLLLNANPVADIANVADLAGVMLNGRWIPDKQIQERLAAIAQFYGN